MFCEKGVLRNFTKFTGKQLCQSLFFNKVAGLRQLQLTIYTIPTISLKRTILQVGTSNLAKARSPRTLIEIKPS